MLKMKRIKIVLAKLGLDGHDRGIKALALYLRDHGMEVIYTGIRQTPQSVARICLQEDPHILGISILSGAHNTLIPKLMQELEKLELEFPVIVGGIIPKKDMHFLQEHGVKGIFTPGSSLNSIVEKIHELVQ